MKRIIEDKPLEQLTLEEALSEYVFGRAYIFYFPSNDVDAEPALLVKRGDRNIMGFQYLSKVLYGDLKNLKYCGHTTEQTIKNAIKGGRGLYLAKSIQEVINPQQHFN